MTNIESMKQNGAVLWWTGNVASANSPKQITPYGDVKQILPFPGAGVYQGPAYTDYIQIPSSTELDFTDGTDFTIEFWLNSRSGSVNTGYQVIGDTNGSLAAGTWSISQWQETSTIGYFGYWDKVNGWILNGYSYYLPNELAHYAFTRKTVNSVTTFTMYVNGISVLSATGSISPNNYSYPFRIGAEPTLRSTMPFGTSLLSELRISHICRYNANFTPPRHQLESDSNTKLLIHFNRNDTTFVDSSPSAHTITAYGDAKQLCSPCGSGVAYFDGSGDVISISDNASLELGANNFTIEFWFNTLTYGPADQWGNKACIISRNQGIAEYGTWTVILDNGSGKIVGYCRDCTSTWTNSSTSSYHNDGTWHHLAWVRNGTSWMLFIDGILESTATYSVTVTDLNQPISIGKDLYFNRDFNGYLSNLRISIGVARYTADFIPQTTPFKPDPYTKLLLHMDGVGNAFYDSRDPPGDNGFPILPDGVTVIPSGTFTTQKMKDGRDYWVWPNSTNSLVVSNHTIFNFGSSDLTILLWFKTSKTDTTNVMTFISRNTASGFVNTSQGSWALLTPNTSPGSVCFYWAQYANGVPILASSLTTYNDNQWHFLIIRRNETTWDMIIDLEIVATVTNSVSMFDMTTPLYIGYDAYYTPRPMIGNIKDLMIFKQALTQDQIAAIMAETYIY